MSCFFKAYVLKWLLQETNLRNGINHMVDVDNRFDDIVDETVCDMYNNLSEH